MAVDNESVKGRTRKSEKSIPPRVVFEMTPPMIAEVERILSVCDLGKAPEVFRRAFTLLRIHVDAALRGQQIIQVDPENPSERYIITLPFVVRKPEESPTHGRKS